METVICDIILGIEGIVGILIFYHFSKRLKLRLDDGFFLPIALWSFFAAQLRVIEDSLGLYWFMRSPYIEVIVSLPLLGLIYILAKLKLNVKKWLSLLAIPAILILSPFFVLRDPAAPAEILILSTIACLPLAPFLAWIDLAPLLCLGIHLFDASTAVVAVARGYREIHLLPAWLMNYSPWLIYPLKLAFLIPLLWIVSRMEDERLKACCFYVIFVFASAAGLRNLIRLAMHV